MENEHKEALKPLVQRKIDLEKELAGLNIAIKALKDIGYDILPEPVKEVLINDSPFAAFKTVKQANTRSTAKIPTTFDPKLKVPAKIKFALKKLNGAFAAQIIDYLHNLDKTADLTTLSNGVIATASKLLKRGEIEAERRGKANFYTLKNTKSKQENNVKNERKQEEAA